jgi:hypothetical protein
MMGRGMGMGGMGGSPLLSTLLAGGMGYLFGSNAAQQAPQVQPYPPYAAPYPAPYPPAAMPASADNGSLAKLQLQLLGQLHESGVLTDDEFARQKQQLLRS